MGMEAVRSPLDGWIRINGKAKYVRVRDGGMGPAGQRDVTNNNKKVLERKESFHILHTIESTSPFLALSRIYKHKEAR